MDEMGMTYLLKMKAGGDHPFCLNVGQLILSNDHLTYYNISIIIFLIHSLYAVREELRSFKNKMEEWGKGEEGEKGIVRNGICRSWLYQMAWLDKSGSDSPTPSAQNQKLYKLALLFRSELNLFLTLYTLLYFHWIGLDHES